MILCSECKQRQIKSRGLCSSCYEKARRSGKFGTKICLICGELRPAAGRGLCELCYQRQLNSGDLSQFSTRRDDIIKLSAELGEMYNSGLTVEEISKRTGIPRTSVWYTLETGGVPKREAKIRDTIQLNEHAFDLINNEQVAYWLGFLYADGSTTRYTTTVTLSTKDEDHLKKLLSFLHSDANIRRWDRTPMSPMSTVTFSNVYLATRLRELGIVQKRVNFQATLDNLPIIYKRDFIRGYFDGDGYISKNAKIPFLGFTGRQDVISWVLKTLLEELPITPKLPRINKGSYEFKYDGKNVVNLIAQWMYKDSLVFLNRKYNLSLQWIN